MLSPVHRRASHALACSLRMWTLTTRVRGRFHFSRGLDTQNGFRVFCVFIMGDLDFLDLIRSMCVRVEPPSECLHRLIYFPCVLYTRR